MVYSLHTLSSIKAQYEAGIASKYNPSRSVYTFQILHKDYAHPARLGASPMPYRLLKLAEGHGKSG